MTTDVSNNSTEILNQTNQILQSSSESCLGQCTANQSGNEVIISGSKIGNLNFNQQCPASASCIMNSTLDTNVSDIMSAMADQEAVTQLGLLNMNFSNTSNNLDIQESITNQITQIMQSTCQATSDVNQYDNMIVLKNSTAGDISISNSGSATANCTMTNTARAVVFNQQTAKSSQKAKRESVLAMIVIAIVIGIIAIGGLVVIFLMSPSGQQAVSKAAGSTPATGTAKGSTVKSAVADAAVVA